MTIQELFLVLHNRLNHYEWRQNNGEESNAEDEFIYSLVLEKMSEELGRYPALEIVPTLSFYLERTKKLLNHAIESTPKNIRNIKPYPIDLDDFLKTGKIKKKTPWQVWMIRELEYYDSKLTMLYNIWESALIASNALMQNQDSADKEINLSENFPIVELKIAFTPKFDDEQTALLLYYLRKCKIIPNYKANSLCTFAHHLFACSSQQVREHLGWLKKQRPSQFPQNDLIAVKNEIQKMLIDIEKSIK